MLRTSSLAVPLLFLLGSSVWAQDPAAVAVQGSSTVQVFEGTAVPAGSQGIQVNVGRVDFGSATIGKTVTKTFTIKNAGAATVRLSDLIELPQGFTVLKRLGSTTLRPGQTTTFVMALNSARPGRLGGNLVIKSGNGKTRLFTCTVSGTALAAPSMRIITRSDAGFRTVGGWSPLPKGISNAGSHFAVPGKGAGLATWTFTGLEPGRYAVSATWPANARAASNAQYTVLDGTKPFRPVTLNQKQTPAGVYDAGTSWTLLGEPYQVNSGSLVVQLSDLADGYVLADAVRIERVWFPGQIITPGAREFHTVGLWAQTPGTTGAAVRAVNQTALATWTFTGIKPGQYRISATWPQGFEGAASASYTIVDGGQTIGRVQIDQQQAPHDLSDAGRRWKDLGELGTLYQVTGSSLVVRLAGPGVIADAVRIERQHGPGTAASEADIIRFLEQCTFGPTEALIAHIRDDLGGDLSAYLGEQLSGTTSGYPSLPLYTDNIDDARDPTRSCYGLTGQAHNDCNRERYTIFPLQRQFFLNALYADDQVRQRLAWALHKIVVVSARDIPRAYRYSPYLQVFDNNAFGNYFDVLYQITLNYPMGVYLNMETSTAVNPNENYAREILQLFSIGLFVLNPDGTYTTNPPTPTYDQDLITNFARLFTGWQRAPNQVDPQTGMEIFPYAQNYLDPMVPRAANQHDRNPKTLLNGFTTQPNQDAPTDLADGINNIWGHSNLGPFLGQSLIQQFTTSNPSAAYVGRVSATFDAYRNDPNQLWYVLEAIVLDPEVRSDVITIPTYGKLREPALFACNLLRAFPAINYNSPPPPSLPQDVSDGVFSVGSYTSMAQDVLRPFTVFSYFLPGYVIPGTSGLLGPEFEILSTVESIKRVNFLNQLVNPNGGAAGYGIGIDANNGRPNGTKPDLTELYNRAVADPSGGQVADYLDRLLLHSTMTSQMRTDLLTAITAVPANNPLRRAKTALYLVGSSSQYQVQR
jgi:hypothetical protein